MGTSTLRRSLHTGLAGLVLTVAGLALVVPAAGAQTDSGDSQTQEDAPRPRPQLTDEQRACLEQAGVTKPAEGQRPTDEQRETFKAAAEECGIELPAGRPGHRGPKLTDEQRACLEGQGAEKPAKGERPTDEQRAAFEAAAEECGIDLPDRPADGEAGQQAPPDDSSDADSENTSV
jgi:hypothetical protein